MRSINFDEGLKSFSINGDENRIIWFNPSDNNMMQRAVKAQKKISEFQSQIENIDMKGDGSPEESTEENAALLEQFDDMVRKQLNYIFNADVYDIVFRSQSPLCIVGNDKKFLVEAFIDAAMDEIELEINKASAASRERISKYTKEYQK